MKRLLFVLSITVTLLSSVFGIGEKESASEDSPGSLTLFAAASTTDLVEELGNMFTKETGWVVMINPASSGTLAKQIEEGAPADVYISASPKWMGYVNDLGRAAESTPFLTNRLVLIAPAGEEEPSLSLIVNSLDLPASFAGRLSLGDPAHVPAGQYAMDSLAFFGWDGPLEDRFLPAADVRGALAVVEQGETERGIVYETDAAKSGKVTVIGVFPEESHKPITYFAALLTESSSGAEQFYRYLTSSEEAAAICRKYGFTPASGE